MCTFAHLYLKSDFTALFIKTKTLASTSPVQPAPMKRTKNPCKAVALLLPPRQRQKREREERKQCSLHCDCVSTATLLQAAFNHQQRIDGRFNFNKTHCTCNHVASNSKQQFLFPPQDITQYDKREKNIPSVFGFGIILTQFKASH